MRSSDHARAPEVQTQTCDSPSLPSQKLSREEVPTSHGLFFNILFRAPQLRAAAVQTTRNIGNKSTSRVVKPSWRRAIFQIRPVEERDQASIVILRRGVHAANMVACKGFKSAHLKNTGKPAKTLRKTRKHTARKHHKVYIVDKILQKAIQSTRCVALVVHVCC